MSTPDYVCAAVSQPVVLVVGCFRHIVCRSNAVIFFLLSNIIKLNQHPKNVKYQLQSVEFKFSYDFNSLY